jgi:protein phosphatase
MKHVFFAYSDIGRVRKENEDTYLYIKNENRVLIGVFDGVGGCDDGKLASDLAKKFTEEFFLKNDLQTENIFEIKKYVENMVEYVNSKIREVSGEKSLATTGSIILFCSGNAFLVHVGDSKIFLIRDEEIFKLTPDHIKEVGGKAFLSQALGGEIEPYFSFENIIKNDIYILTTDGLTLYLSEEDIKNEFLKNSLDDAVLNVIKKANEKGGQDNITVIALKVL